MDHSQVERQGFGEPDKKLTFFVEKSEQMNLKTLFFAGIENAYWRQYV